MVDILQTRQDPRSEHIDIDIRISRFELMTWPADGLKRFIDGMLKLANSLVIHDPPPVAGDEPIIDATAIDISPDRAQLPRAPLTDEEIIRRLADGEDPYDIDPDYGCTNPLTGYYPAWEVAEEQTRRDLTEESQIP